MKGKRRWAVASWIFILLVSFSPVQGAAPKNIILLIGDGMGPEAVGLAIYYNRFMKGMDKRLNMERLMEEGNTGYCLTYQYGTVVTDSASAATALASGVKTRDATIGKAPDGRPVKSIVDVAGKLGKSSGVISDTRLTHATPAAFYAHIIHRDVENEVAVQFVERNDLTVALSGGAQHFIPRGMKVEEHPDLRGIGRKAGWGSSKRKDSRDLIREAKAKGYSIVANEEELGVLDPRSAGKVLGFFSASGFPSAIDRQPGDQTGVPPLSQMTAKALAVLEKNPRGFFLMVEGGQIDWVEHGNDVAGVLHEMLEFDRAVGVVLDFAKVHPDTLVILTADHDTGGLAIAYSNHNAPPPVTLANGETWKTKHNFADKSIFEKMARQKKSLLKIVLDSKGNPAALKKEVEENTAFSITEDQAAALLSGDVRAAFPATKDFREFFGYGAGNPSARLAGLFGWEMNTVWAAGTHTHTPVMVVAQGPWGEKFRGLLDNAEIGRIMGQSWGSNLPDPE